MIYLLLFSCLLLVGFNTYMLLRKTKQPQAEPEPVPNIALSAAEVVKQLLPQLNCHYLVKEKREDEELLEFDYQGGHFNVSVSTKNEVFKIGFLFFFSTSTDELEKVRMVCNQLNIHTRMTRFAYSHLAEKNQIFVHLFTSGIVVDSMPNLLEYWRSMLNSCFEHKRIFLQQIDTTKEQGGEALNIDADRIIFLMSEHEIAQQEYGGNVRMQKESPYSLLRFVEEAMDMPGTEINKISIVTNRMETITDSEKIQNYLIHDAIIYGEGEEAHFVRRDAQIVLSIKRPTGLSQNGVIMLQAEKETLNSLYFRATYCVPPHSISKDFALTDKNNAIETFSILMAFDKTDANEERSIISQIWEEAISKTEQNQVADLSEEQKLMLACTFPDQHYIIHKGHKAFLKKRYYEAIFYLEQVFNNMKDHFHEMKSSERNAFYEITFYLGFCYNDLGLYQKAYYYLDAIYNQNRISYTKEYVISLVNSGDFRALPVINHILDRLDQISSMQEDENRDENGISHTMKQFSNFLLKQKGYALVNIGELEEAEKLYKEMLKDPENENTALTELANIERMRKGR